MIKSLIYSRTAQVNNIDNTPDLHSELNLNRLIKVIEKLQILWNRKFVFNSGYRCTELNKLVGGTTNSAHTKGLACDIVIENDKQNELMDKLKNSSIEFDQAINYPKRGFIHIGLNDSGRSRRQLLTSVDKGKYVKYE